MGCCLRLVCCCSWAGPSPQKWRGRSATRGLRTEKRGAEVCEPQLGGCFLPACKEPKPLVYRSCREGAAAPIHRITLRACQAHGRCRVAPLAGSACGSNDVRSRAGGSGPWALGSSDPEARVRLQPWSAATQRGARASSDRAYAEIWFKLMLMLKC